LNPFKLSFENLEEFAEAIRQELQCPITIEDANHRLLAYSLHDEKTDPARIATIIGRRVPEKVINQLWKEGAIPALLCTTEPVRVKCIDEVGLDNRVAISIWKQKEVIGFIWALETEKPLSEKQMAILKNAAEAATNELLQLQVRNRKKEDRVQGFLWQLLTGHLKETGEIIEGFHTLKITPPPAFAVMVFQFQQTITRKEEQQISYLLKTNQQLKTILYTFDSNQLILLVSAPNIDDSFKALDPFIFTFQHHLADRYSISNVKPGVSSIYQDYRKINKAYQEALKVLSTKESFPLDLENVYYYQKLGIYQLFDIIIDKQQKERYENQSLKKLQSYDQKHHTNLVETLEVYLDNDSNVAETAKELVVHPNTLIYRLKRITEISEIDLKDPNQKMMMFIDIKLEKYLKG
jgi:DNA-binding PucR family transcriptional regulator